MERKRQFLTTLFDNLAGYIEVRAISKQGVNRYFYKTTEIDKLIKNLKERLFTGEIYFGVCPRDSKKGKEENIKQVRCLWIDLDCEDAKDQEKKLSEIRKFEFEPSIIVNSGHGLHCYWLLDEIYEIHNEKELMHIKGIVKGLTKAIPGADHAFDLSRILRIPGTQNRKIPGNIAEVELINFNPELRYPLQELEMFKVEVEPPVEIKAISYEDIPERFYQLLSEDEKLKNTWEGNRKLDSPSEYRLSMANLLTNLEFTESQMKAILIALPSGETENKTGNQLEKDCERCIGLAKKKDYIEEKKEIPQKENLTSPGLKDVLKAFKKWLYFKDYTVIEICLTTIIANRLHADPFWLFLISPSGGSKTELFRSLKGKDTYELSDLTEHTLISGQIGKKAEPSLLPFLNNKVLVMKDFTTVLSMRYDEREKILSTMREIYDGYISKSFGTGKKFNWIGKVGFIAGVTPVIDKYYGVINILGPRFVQYRTKHHNRREETKKAMENMGKEKQMREELNYTSQQFLNQVSDPNKVEVPEDIFNKIIDLADYTATVRSQVSRDGRTREVDFSPEPEIPTRLAKCFLMFIKGLCAIREKKEPTNNEYILLKNIARDSVPIKKDKVIQCLNKAEIELSTQDIGSQLNLPTSTVRLILEDLFMLNFTRREGKGKFKWLLSDNGRQIINASEIFS